MSDTALTESRPVEITYDEVEEYYNKHKSSWKQLLKNIEKEIVKARDLEDIPAYSTKCRIKTVDSIYLKTKRKNTTLDKITDYAGLRILCLFEEDLSIVHGKLLEIMKKENLSITNFKIYNFKDDYFRKKFITTLQTAFPNITEPEVDEKLSGYKSIHYIVTINHGGYICPLEIQLRTLLQDVWGELEHALSYKRGVIHPHIKKSFLLLSRDIETNDSLMSHLKEIHNKETKKDHYGAKRYGLRTYFMYDENILPAQLNNENIIENYTKYNEKIIHLTKNRHIVSDASYDEIDSMLRDLINALYKQYAMQVEEDQFLNYWINMEKAVLKLFTNKYDAALDIYNSLLKNHTDKYILYFRIGEINLINGDTPKALRAFDRSEKILQEAIDKNNTSLVLRKNLFLIKMKLAYTYWMLGEEYIDQAINKTTDVTNIYESFFKNNGESAEEEGIVYNNVCWYHMEKCQKIILKIKNLDRDPKNSEREKKDSERKKLGHDLKKHTGIMDNAYNVLKKSIENNNTNGKTNPSNWFDTAACYHYYKFLDTRCQEDKILAQQYATECDRGTNYATLSLTSLSMHLNHITDIMALE